jgi:hypothetical protein
MATDATITTTNKDFFSGASFAIPVGVLLGGSYLYFHGRGSKPKAGPSEDQVTKVVLGSAAVLAAVVLYKSYGKQRTPIVGCLPNYQPPAALKR